VTIILGDAKINFSGGIRDMRKKEFLESLLITVFAIYGNHEQRS
jgi:3-oxoacid CoA-transferase subunit A